MIRTLRTGLPKDKNGQEGTNQILHLPNYGHIRPISANVSDVLITISPGRSSNQLWAGGLPVAEKLMLVSQKNEHLLNLYCVRGIMLNAGDTEEGKMSKTPLRTGYLASSLHLRKHFARVGDRADQTENSPQ